MANTKWRRTQKGLPRIFMEELSPLQKEELTLLCFCEQSVDGQLGFSMGVGGLPWGLDGKESACRARDLGSVAGWEDPLEKGMASHSRSVAWRMPWTEEPGGLQSVGSQRARHDWASNTFIFTFTWGSSLNRCVRPIYCFISPNSQSRGLSRARRPRWRTKNPGVGMRWCLSPASATVREAFGDALKAWASVFLPFNGGYNIHPSTLPQSPKLWKS